MTDALDPALVTVLTRLEEADQDLVQRLCYGYWEDVTFDPDDRVVVRGRRTTISLLEPELDPDLEQYFESPTWPELLQAGLRDQTEIQQILAAPPYGGSPAVHLDGCLDMMNVEHQAPDCRVTARQVHAPVSHDDHPHLGERCVLPGDSLTEIQAEVVQQVLEEHRAPCPCGCGQPVVNKPVGRQRVYATDACRKRVSDRKRTALAQEQAAQATPATADPAPAAVEGPTTLVLAPELIEELKLELVPAPEPVVVPPAPRPAHVPRPVFCVRCGENGHYVEECKEPLVPRKKAAVVLAPALPAAPAAPAAPVKAQRRGPATIAHTDGPRVITCGRCHQVGHSIFTCTVTYEPLTRNVLAPVPSPVDDNVLTAHSTALLDLCKDGLPMNLGYDFKEDVLAMYGLDHDLLEAALRNPERVEIRPETHTQDKRYCILGFYRGDLEIILGMRSPSTPRVIAAYAGSRLAHDTHRPGVSGGSGGSKATAPKGLPKSSRQVATRLRARGALVTLDMVEDTTEVHYKDQMLGRIACNGDRATCEADYQRTIRRMEAIDRRESVG